MSDPKIQQLEEDEAYKEISQKYPHIAKKLIIFWGSEFCEPYLDSLFIDTRSGTRRGFPPEDILLLLKIRILHETLFELDRKTDVWTYSS